MDALKSLKLMSVKEGGTFSILRVLYELERRQFLVSWSKRETVVECVRRPTFILGVLSSIHGRATYW